MAVILVLGGAFFLACWAMLMDDYVINFQRGYRCFYTNEGMVLELNFDELGSNERSRMKKIFDSDRSLPRVGPDVDGYRVYGSIITGHVSNPTVARISPQRSKNGYFVIDVRMDRLYDDLSKEEWKAKLREYGVNHEPKLHKPSRFDKYCGRNKPQPLN